MNYKFQIVGGNQGQSVTVFYDGKIFSANDGHPNFGRILGSIADGADGAALIRLFDTAAEVEARFNLVSNRVVLKGGVIYFDGQPIHNSVTSHIVRSLDEGNDNFAPFVNFLVKLQQNPVKDSVETLFNWLQAEKFSLTERGDIIGYKSVYRKDGAFRSVSRGTASVNGVSQTGNIVQNIGDVVTMPRAGVTLDPKSACNVGLHVGTYGYASTFSGDTVIEVLVDPADVVSVPHNCNGTKMRVCRYTVAKVSDGKHSEAVVFDEAEDDGCDDCDECYCMDCQYGAV